jgi:hypothetical protein
MDSSSCPTRLHRSCPARQCAFTLAPSLKLALYAGMKPHERVEVLLAMLGGRLRMTLPRAAVEAV